MNQLVEKTRLIREISTGTVVSMLIIFITMYLPVLGFFMAVVLPMPVLYFRLKLGRAPGALIIAIVLLMTGVSAGGLSVDMLFYGALLFSGFFLGEFLEMRKSIEKSIIYTVGLTLGISIALFFLYASASGVGVGKIVSGYVAENVKLTLSLYESIGMSQENVQLISNSVKAIQYVLVRIIPALLIVMMTFVVWMNTLFIKKILAGKRIFLKSLQDLNRWKTPEQLVWFAILLGVMMFIPVRAVKLVSFNCILVLMLIYFFQGMAIVSFIFEKKNLPNLIRVFLYSLIGIQQILILIIVGLGFFDTWMNFRKLGIGSDINGGAT